MEKVIMRKFGFTLVEVLITVGIIGVVAALTIPTIIQNSNNRKFASHFKKSLSTLSQAAIMSQAQYDSDYSSLNTASSVEDCGSESLAKSNLTMCGLLNSTLSGHKFLGMYGTAKGANARSIYTVAKNSLPKSALSEENTMIFALADGSFVGFNKNATRCGITPGTPISAEVINEALTNCIGFIDVNGPNPPNKEIACKDSTATCNEDKKIGDVFPVLFHNSIVEPLTEELLAQAYLARRSDISKWKLIQPPSSGLTQAQCEALPAEYGIINCPDQSKYGGDRWAAAVKECGGVQNLPTREDLYALAKAIYPTCNDYWKTCNGTADFSNLPENLSGLSLSSGIWQGTDEGTVNAHSATYLAFYNSYSQYRSASRDNPFIIVCLGDL